MAPSDGCSSGIVARRLVLGMGGSIIGTEVKAVAAIVTKARRGVGGTRQQDGVVVTDACAADHGPMACPGVSLRMKISRAW